MCYAKIPITVYIAKIQTFCYNTTAATLSSGKEVRSMEYVIAFVISVAAGVVANYISKRLESDT